MHTRRSPLLAALVLLAGCAAGDRRDEAPVRSPAPLDDPDPRVRWETARDLVAGPGAGAAALHELAGDPRGGPGAAWAVFILGRTEAGFDPAPFLRHADPEVRYRAAECAGLSGASARPSMRRTLQEALDDEHPMVALAAAWALCRSAPHEGALAVLVAGLGRDARTFAAREAGARLRDLYGPVVSYDPNRGYHHQDTARARWVAELRRDPRLAGVRIRVPEPPPPAGQVALLRELLARLDPPPRETGRLLDIWRRAISPEGRHEMVVQLRLQILERLLELLHGEGLLHADYALTLLNAGHVREAVEHYHKALRLHPGLPGLLNDCGIALEAAGREEQALAMYGRAAAAAPQDEVPRLNQGHVLLSLGRTEEAVRVLLEAEALAPERWPYHRVMLGRVLDASRARSENGGAALARRGRPPRIGPARRTALELPQDATTLRPRVGWVGPRPPEADGLLPAGEPEVPPDLRLRHGPLPPP